jgi:hypothetical protein
VIGGVARGLGDASTAIPSRCGPLDALEAACERRYVAAFRHRPRAAFLVGRDRSGEAPRVDVPITTDPPKARKKARSLTAVHAAWCIGPRRVAIACAEDSRPAACCIVDALVARGYDAELQTGADARSALRRDDDPGRLRVLWLPDHGSRSTKDKLRRALDPQGAGDVLVLASPTPRGVIEAIEAFAAGKDRPRARSGPRRTYLEHPTRCEQTVDVRKFASATLAAAGATAAVLLAIRFGGEMLTPRPQEPSAQYAPVSAPRERPHIDRTVLGTVAPARLESPIAADDDTALDGEEPMHRHAESSLSAASDVPRSRTAKRRPEPTHDDVAVQEAPLEDTHATETAAHLDLRPTPSPALARSRTHTIDPFE